MKKILILLVALLLVGCNLVESTAPTDIASSFLDSLKSMDFEKAKTVSDEALTEKIRELETVTTRDASAEAMIKKLLHLFDYQILSEEISGESATVVIRIQGLSETALTKLGSDVMQAGLSVVDPSNKEEVSQAVLAALETLDVTTLERQERELTLSLIKDGRDWRLTEDTLSRLTDALLP